MFQLANTLKTTPYLILTAINLKYIDLIVLKANLNVCLVYYILTDTLTAAQNTTDYDA